MPSADIRLIAGHKSGEIETILGYRGRDEIIHRDDLVVTERPMTTETLMRERSRAERRSRRDDGRDRAARARGRLGAGAGPGRGAR